MWIGWQIVAGAFSLVFFVSLSAILLANHRQSIKNATELPPPPTIT